MLTNRVMAVGFVLMQNSPDDGYLSLKTWTRLSGQQGSFSEEYDRLTYLEALEVIVAHADTNRPGWEVGDGWSQPPLFA